MPTPKAITLRQPWATMVGMGEQTIITRAHGTRHRGRTIIHAGVTPPEEFFCTSEPEIIDGEPRWEPYDTPLGAIVGTCELVDVVPVVVVDSPSKRSTAARYAPRSHFAKPMILVIDSASAITTILPSPGVSATIDMSEQLTYNEFATGRYAWMLSDAKPTTERCPACWGFGSWPPPTRALCPVCHGKLSCEPIPATGKRGLWEWVPSLPHEASEIESVHSTQKEPCA